MPYYKIEFRYDDTAGWVMVSWRSDKPSIEQRPLQGQTFDILLNPEDGLDIAEADFSYDPNSQQMNAFTLPMLRLDAPGTLGLSQVSAESKQFQLPQGIQRISSFHATGTFDISNLRADSLRPVVRQVLVREGVDEAQIVCIHMPADMPGVLFVVTNDYALRMHLPFLEIAPGQESQN